MRATPICEVKDHGVPRCPPRIQKKCRETAYTPVKITVASGHLQAKIELCTNQFAPPAVVELTALTRTPSCGVGFAAPPQELYPCLSPPGLPILCSSSTQILATSLPETLGIVRCVSSVVRCQQSAKHAFGSAV